MDIRLGRGAHPHAADFAGEHRWDMIQLADVPTEKRKREKYKAAEGETKALVFWVASCAILFLGMTLVL